VLRNYNKPDLLREGNLEESAMVDMWMEVEAHHYDPAIFHIIRECVIKPMIGGGARDQAIVDENVEKLRKVLEVYERRLSESEYLAGDFVSVADLNHFPYTYYLMTTEYATLVESCTNVKAVEIMGI
jgi:glutathione S-transferase